MDGRELNTNANLTKDIHYLIGLPNIQQENLFEAEGILLGAVFLAPELIHEITLEPCLFSQKRNQLLFQAMKELQNKNPTFHIESEIFLSLNPQIKDCVTLLNDYLSLVNPKGWNNRVRNNFFSFFTNEV
ncbi:hypothetical protein J7E63_13710 [Bacillus sp. ISL-75]|uniref:DnaB-like helicase N-terminal domain-containing protein n=1 Tax=Bacillus sp. ISL-75 TaxID=2819137 RepID=UPI001BE6B57C|nr:DnaB-like helicase N-terminal domain-containing protein [Bacillus sp. ISL-75]MBT2727995.1 hypothetical protein [Bacillus sp. ISL-75]